MVRLIDPEGVVHAGILDRPNHANPLVCEFPVGRGPCEIKWPGAALKAAARDAQVTCIECIAWHGVLTARR